MICIVKNHKMLMKDIKDDVSKCKTYVYERTQTPLLSRNLFPDSSAQVTECGSSV